MRTYIKLEDCRPQVLRFALLMEQVLRENDHKGGWQGMTPEQINRRLEQESQELSIAISRLHDAHRLPVGAPVKARDEKRFSRESVLEAVDVANFAMFLVDVLGELPELL